MSFNETFQRLGRITMMSRVGQEPPRVFDPEPITLKFAPESPEYKIEEMSH